MQEKNRIKSVKSTLSEIRQYYTKYIYIYIYICMRIYDKSTSRELDLPAKPRDLVSIFCVLRTAVLRNASVVDKEIIQSNRCWDDARGRVAGKEGSLLLKWVSSVFHHIYHVKQRKVLTVNSQLQPVERELLHSLLRQRTPPDEAPERQRSK